MSNRTYYPVASLLALTSLAVSGFALQAEPGERERDVVTSITPHRSENRYVPADPTRDEGPTGRVRTRDLRSSACAGYHRGNFSQEQVGSDLDTAKCPTPSNSPRVSTHPG